MFLMPSGGRWEGGDEDFGRIIWIQGKRRGESVVAEKVYGKDWRKLNDN